MKNALAAITVLIAGSALADPGYEQNLIVNGDAEQGANAKVDCGVTDMPGWAGTSTSSVHRMGYDSPGGWPASSDPGAPDRGLSFFVGECGQPVSISTQTLSIANLASDIDSGIVSFDLAGYLGGYSSQDDNAVLGVSFRDGSGTQIGSASIGPVLASDRNNVTGMFARETSGALPTGTRTLVFTLTMTRLAGSANDGYADSLSFVLHGCAADFNADGFVDFFDFNDFVSCFEGDACPPGKTADFNNDGFADFFDFNDFVDAFEKGC